MAISKVLSSSRDENNHSYTQKIFYCWAILFKFTGSPFKARLVDNRVQNVTFTFFSFALLQLLFTITIALPINFFLEKYAGVRVTSGIKYGSPLIVIALIFSPIIEEAIFRGGLRSAKYSLIYGPPLIIAILGNSVLLPIAIFSLLLFISHVAKILLISFNYKIRRTFIERYPIVFWMYVISFALAHTSKYNASGLASILIIFHVLPQLMLGITASYLRLNFGLSSAIFFHFLNNAVAISLLLIYP